MVEDVQKIKINLDPIRVVREKGFTRYDFSIPKNIDNWTGLKGLVKEISCGILNMKD